MTPWDKDPAFVWPLLEAPERPRSTYEGDLGEERMPAPLGMRGPKVSETVRWARAWWDKQGRHLVRGELPLNPEQGGIPSGILRGVQFHKLTRDECLQVVRTYYKQVFVPLQMFERDPDKARFILDPQAGPAISAPRETITES
jgi:hypothetical protein